MKTYDADQDGSLSKQDVQELGLARYWFLYDLDKDEVLTEVEWQAALARASAKNGLYAIDLGGQGDVTETHVKWTFKRVLPNIPSPLYLDGVLYMMKEGGIFAAVDAETGEMVKSERIEEVVDEGYFASPVAAGTRILTASHPGKVAILEAGADWKVLSVVDFGEQIYATPALAEGQIFLRTQKALYCFES